MEGIACFQTFTSPLSLYFPAPFIRRCGERDENSKFVIVFICIEMATEIHIK